MRIGVLGGTFDPVHHGHLMLAEIARDQLGLGQVLWVPAAEPPHKQGQAITPARHRVEMLKRAIEDNLQFALSRADLDRPGPHYTVDLLDILIKQFPEAELYFLMGGDSLRDLPTWHQPERLITQCRLVVMARPGHTIDFEQLEESLPGLKASVDIVEPPAIDIAGSQITGRIRAGKTIRYLVPDAVAEYIEKHHLYQTPDRERV